MDKIECPVCDGTGELKEPFDVSVWEEVHDPISGHTGYEVKSVRTGQVVLRSSLEGHMVSCFNCEGTGYLEWDEEDE